MGVILTTYVGPGMILQAGCCRGGTLFHTFLLEDFEPTKQAAQGFPSDMLLIQV